MIAHGGPGNEEDDDTCSGYDPPLDGGFIRKSGQPELDQVDSDRNGDDKAEEKQFCVFLVK